MLCNLNLRPLRWPTKRVLTRSTKSINWDSVAVYLANLPLICSPSDTLDGLVDQYNSGWRKVFDLHAPLRERLITLRPINRWITDEVLQHRIEKRLLAIDFEIDCSNLLLYKTILKDAKTNFVSHQVHECASDKRALFNLICGLMCSSSKRSLPTRSCDQEIADDLCSFFSSKASALVSRFAATETLSCSDPA